jgi:hypothetical protein
MPENNNHADKAERTRKAALQIGLSNHQAGIYSQFVRENNLKGKKERETDLNRSIDVP